jgi:hypothetical protein
MCLNEKHSKFCIDKYLSDNYPIQNGLKYGDALSPHLFNFVLEYVNRNVQENLVGLKSTGIHQLLIYVDAVKLLGDKILVDIIMKKHKLQLTLVWRLV